MQLVTYQREAESRPGFLYKDRVIDLQGAHQVWVQRYYPGHAPPTPERGMLSDWLEILRAGEEAGKKSAPFTGSLLRRVKTGTCRPVRCIHSNVYPCCRRSSGRAS